MRTYVDSLEQALALWRSRGYPDPEVMLVSGSGLAVDVGRRLGEPSPLADFVPFPVHEVEGHPHAIEVVEPLPGRAVLYQQGRLHSYQGYDAHQVVFTVRLAALLGVKTLVMTNAAGSLRPESRPGDLMVIDDQINLSSLNPLRGELPPAWGPRFPDMVDAHDPALRRIACDLAAGLGLNLGQGVYAGLAGPSYETPAEIRMLRAIGADLVGMSTVLEVIAARHMGVRCLCFSLVTNLAAGVTDGPLDHEEVLTAGQAASGPVAELVAALLRHPDITEATLES